ncbi:tRNA threonylcarbamoyladenosine dehydratase [Tannockella kyphosi]|uniref:tRNA threonylcarbamoyladenosine dehydratase n=1 Tax=Tannockella kyphosi TaxID=2899121 RepID=UPI002010D79F|nr:tRNA threonylcarbamoyladenosine dehydratase [Tannockella kyphosi]
MEQFSRTIKIIGEEPIQQMQQKKVAILGLGGVGSYVVEALCRAGIGNLVLVDHDVVDITNINRQLYALHSTVAKKKVEIAKARCLDINPNIHIECFDMFYLPGEDKEYILEGCDYVVDAIDTIKAKIALIEACNQRNIPIISSMGTGNKLNPSLFEITTIDKTSVCPLAKVMRKELKNRGIYKTNVLYSKELPIQTQDRTPGSISFVPSSAGLKIASFVFEQLTKGE